jgi:hypothetical protein
MAPKRKSKEQINKEKKNKRKNDIDYRLTINERGKGYKLNKKIAGKKLTETAGTKKKSTSKSQKSKEEKKAFNKSYYENVRTSFNKKVEEYIQKTNEIKSYICLSCEGLFLKKSIEEVPMTTVLFKDLLEFIENCCPRFDATKSVIFCHTCCKNILNKKVGLYDSFL